MANLNWKKAIISGIISYAVIFLVISGLMFVPGAYDAATMQWASWAQALTLIVGFVVVWAIATYYYFKTKPSNALKEGIMLGIVMAIVAFVIEIPVMVYGFAAQMGWAWFAQWNLLLGYLLMFVAAIVAAYMKK